MGNWNNKITGPDIDSVMEVSRSWVVRCIYRVCDWDDPQPKESHQISMKGLLFPNPALAHTCPVARETDLTVSRYMPCTIHNSLWRRQNKVKVVTEIYNTYSTPLLSSQRHDQFTFRHRLKYHPPPSFTKDSRERERQKERKKEWATCRSVELYQSLQFYRFWRWCMIFWSILLSLNFDHCLLYN